MAPPKRHPRVVIRGSLPHKHGPRPSHVLSKMAGPTPPYGHSTTVRDHSPRQYPSLHYLLQTPEQSTFDKSEIHYMKVELYTTHSKMVQLKKKNYLTLRFCLFSRKKLGCLKRQVISIPCKCSPMILKTTAGGSRSCPKPQTQRTYF